MLAIPTLLKELEILSADLLHILSDFQEFISEPIIFADQVFDLSGIIPDYVEMLSSSILTISENAINIVENITRNLILILLILATTYYLLRDWEDLRNWFYDRIPENYKADSRNIYIEIREIWAGYVKGNITLMIIVGVAFTFAWLLIGVPGALILGLLTGILTIIPDLGPAIAAGLAVIVGLIEGSQVLNVSNLMFGAIILIIYLVLINIKGIWIRPKIFAKSVHMHEGIVFAAIIIAVMVQGILGALVIIPLMASISVISRYAYNKLLEPTILEK
jgi:predicted PurR-regulated permease PerM